MAAVKLPGSPTSPYDIIQSKYKDIKYLLGRQFEQDERALQSQYMTDQEYQVKSVELNSHYNKLLETQTFEHRSKIQNLDRLKASVSRGETTDQAAYQAGWRMVLPQESYNARFPTLSKERGAAQARPLSTAAISSATSLMSDFAWAAEEKKGIEWGKPYRTKEGLIEKYSDWRAQVGYDQLDTIHQKQLDQRWDAVMRGEKKFRDWFADDKKTKPVAEVKSLRSKGRLGKAMSKKFVPRQYSSGRPGSVAGSVTPIGRSFITGLEQNSKKHLPPTAKAPSAEELKQTGTEEAYNKGVALGYWR